MPDLDAADVQRRLDLPADTMGWLERIARPSGSQGPDLPEDAQAERLLERLGADPADRAEALAARPDPHDHPALWWVLDRIYHELLGAMGDGVPVEGFPGWPPLPASAGAVGRHLYVWLYLAALPAVRRYHADRGIADDVSWASLGGLGRAMRAHRAAPGESGLGLFGLWSPPLRLRGAHYQLGRLEFSRGAVSLSNGPCGWALVGPAEQVGGVSSAAFVQWPDGRDGALTRTHTPLARMRQTAPAQRYRPQRLGMGNSGIHPEGRAQR